ncbi:MAG: M23 family metallopeptidase [Ignavibacteria bacterium]|nr:M23 family metallopeptidase [Ignavibacteria bacterium]
MSKKTIYGLIAVIGLVVVLATTFYLISTFKALDDQLEAESRVIDLPPIHITRTDSSDYIFPLDSTAYLTSTFCEFRETHHHGGIDLGTNNLTGQPVFASRDGFVKRISLSPFGYGKVIYMQHPDSFITVYAHLENFEPKLNKFVRDKQLSTLSQNIDHELDSDAFIFRKGEVIGFAGESGSGTPHLHFEIREPNGNRLNPLSFPNVKIALIDTISPSFELVKIVPVGYDSRIDLDINEKVLYDNQGKKPVQAYTHLNGKAGILVKISDRSHAKGTNDFGIKKIRMSLNDQANLIYSINFEKIENDRLRKIFFTRDHYEFYLNKQVVYKLFDEYGENINFYPNGSDGILDSKKLDKGMNTIYLTAYDNYDNKTSLVFGLYVTDDMPTADWSINATQISIKSSLPISKFAYSFFDSKGKVLDSNEMKNLYTTEVKLPNRKYEWLSVKITNHGFENPQSLLIGSNGDSISNVENVTLKYFHQSCLLQFNSKNVLDSKTEILVEANDQEFRYPVSNSGKNSYSSLIDVNPNIYGGVNFYLNNNNQKSLLMKGNFLSFDKDSITIKTYDDKFLVTIPVGAFYHPIFAKLNYEKNEISFYPKNILIKSPIRVESISPDKKNIRYGVNRLSEWKDISSQTINGKMVGYIHSSLGDIKLISDNTPPEILDWRILRKGNLNTSMGEYSTTAEVPIFVFKVRDVGFGIDFSAIEVFVNGVRALAEYDPDISSFFIIIDRLAEKGKNNITIRLRDHGQNLTEKIIHF